MKLKIICLFLLVFSAGLLQGAFLGEVNFLGFTEDGGFAAVEQYWIADGSGFPGAEITVMNVEDNTVLKNFRIQWTEEMMYSDEPTALPEDGVNPALVLAREQSAYLLDSLGISRRSRCVHCVSHPLTDTGVDPLRVSFATWVASPMYMGPEYTVEIDNHVTPLPNPPEWLSMFDTPVLLEVSVHDDQGSRILHYSEEAFMEGFEYVSNYRIRDVYVQDGRMVLILNTTEPGFEGPDGLFRMVTGNISPEERI
ncbi:MAG: DUF2259 domain-containing protein [Candidatus Aegiribacteria sp.]|nr:DUF2259 domain-containing protein [Candidatus Aegiribacteria sp.]MBD3295546.1 DUF2259 domain-containing protein [Candidatus Fermentibacteria bacterium]